MIIFIMLIEEPESNMAETLQLGNCCYNLHAQNPPHNFQLFN